MLNTTTITSTVAMVLNLSSLIGSLITCMICISILAVLWRSIVNTRDIVLLLTANSYLALFGFSLGSVMTNIDMLRGDLNWFVGKETFSCRLRGYVLYALIGVIYNTFGLQAIFRFCRVLYPYYIWLQYCRTYAVIIPFLWIISFLLLLPVHIWHDVQLIPMENVCLLAMNNARGFIWCTVAIYALPMNIISIVYIQLMRFVRRTSIPASARSKRDVIAVRRIVLIVFVLMLIGIPTVVLELMLPFTDAGKPLFYRISNITMVVAMLALSFLLVHVTSQVKEVLMRLGKQNEIVPTNTHRRSKFPATNTRY